MTRLARIGFIAASVANVLIGIVHNTVQATTLSAPEILTHLDAYGVVPELGPSATLSNLFQGLSYLMGFFMIALGAVSLAALFDRPKTSNPPVSVAMINMVMLAIVSWSGFVYLSMFQAIGGIVGIMCFGLTVWSALKFKD